MARRAAPKASMMPPPQAMAIADAVGTSLARRAPAATANTIAPSASRPVTAMAIVASVPRGASQAPRARGAGSRAIAETTPQGSAARQRPALVDPRIRAITGPVRATTAESASRWSPLRRYLPPLAVVGYVATLAVGADGWAEPRPWLVGMAALAVAFVAARR